MSSTNARLTCALLNASHWIHRAIIIARTVTGTGHCLKGPNRWPVSSNRVPPRRPTDKVSLHNNALFDLYFANSHPPDSSWRRRRQPRRGGSFMGGQHPISMVISTPMSASCPMNRGVRIMKVWSASVHGVLMLQSSHHLRNDLKCVEWDTKPCSIQSNPRSSTKDPCPQTIAICNLESALRPHLNTLYS